MIGSYGRFFWYPLFSKSSTVKWITLENLGSSKHTLTNDKSSHLGKTLLLTLQYQFAPPSSQQSTKFVYSRELSFFASQHMTFFGCRFVETVRWTPWGWSPCWGPRVETWKELALDDDESLPLWCLNPSLPWTPQFCEIGRFLSLKQVRCSTAKSILIGREFITGNR